MYNYNVIVKLIKIIWYNDRGWLPIFIYLHNSQFESTKNEMAVNIFMYRLVYFCIIYGFETNIFSSINSTTFFSQRMYIFFLS